MGELGFKKSERICGAAADELFNGAKRCYSDPLRAFYKISDAADAALPSVRILVSVPKKLFKRAVRRNLLKRRIREAYRLNKGTLTDVATPKGRHVEIAFIYNSNEQADYRTIENGVTGILAQIVERL